MEKVDIRGRILICDDDEKIANHHKTILEGSHQVTVVLSGEELLDNLSRDNKYDIVLLDNNMPGIKGIEVLPLIKEKYPHINVIMISGDNIHNESLSLGASEFLNKPTSIQVIQGTVKKVLFVAASKPNLFDLFSDIRDQLHNIFFLTGNAKDNIEFQDLRALSKDKLIEILHENTEEYEKVERFLIKTEKTLSLAEQYLHEIKVGEIRDVDVVKLSVLVKKEKDFYEKLRKVPSKKS